MNNAYLIRNPFLRFRNEGDRCILYTIDDFFHTPETLTVVYPYEVILLLLFDGRKSTTKVHEEYSYIFNLKAHSALNPNTIINNIMDNLYKRTKLKKLLVRVIDFDKEIIKQTQDRYSIKDFITPDKKLVMDFSNLRLNSPLSVNFNMTTICKFKCKYCYHPLNPITDYISPDRLKIIFKELKELNCESIMLTGGDPMLNPNINSIIEILGETKLNFSLSTKSILTKEQLKSFFDCGLKNIQISLDSIDPFEVQYLLGINDTNYVKKILQMMHTCSKIGMRIRVKSVITKHNIESFPKSLEAFSDVGVEKIHITQYGKTHFRHSDDLFPTDNQFTNLKNEIHKFMKKNTHKFNIIYDDFVKTYRYPNNYKIEDEKLFFSKRGICNAGRNSITLLPNGEVFVCENLPYKKKFVLGDLRKQSVMEYWNSDRVKQWLSPPPRNTFADGVPCKTCDEKYYNRCHKIFSRCLRYCYETFDNVNMPDINCPYAKFKKYRIT